MKKVLLSIVLMCAVCAGSSVMAQDVKKEACCQKTECPKTCCKKTECPKDCCENSKCNKSGVKCCKACKKKCTNAAFKKCFKDNRQAMAGKK